MRDYAIHIPLHCNHWGGLVLTLQSPSQTPTPTPKQTPTPTPTQNAAWMLFEFIYIILTPNHVGLL